MHVVVHRKAGGAPSGRWVQSVLNATARRLSARLRARAENCAVIFVGDDRMRTLNRLYRGKDCATDVLAFSGCDGELGDIIIDVPHVCRQARRFGVAFKEECARALIHGALHLFGYDHNKRADARRMFKLQETTLGDILS